MRTSSLRPLSLVLDSVCVNFFLNSGTQDQFRATFVLEVDTLSVLGSPVSVSNKFDFVRAQGTHGCRGFLLGFMNGVLNGFFVFHDCSVDLLDCELGLSISNYSIVSDPVFVKCCHGVFVRLFQTRNPTLLGC